MDTQSFLTTENNTPSSTIQYPEILKEIWEKRAERLARLPEEEETGQQVQLLVLRLGREFYAIESDHVFDIRQVNEVTLVPRVPDWVVGVVNLRGRILSLVDLRRFFNLPAPIASAEDKLQPESQPTAYQVLVEASEMEVTLLVDEVLSIITTSLNHIENYLEILGEMRPEYVRGIVSYRVNPASQDNSILVILNIAAILADPRLVIEEKII